MKPTYQVLENIFKLNPNITHFSLRLYRHITGEGLKSYMLRSEYRYINVDELDNLEKLIELYESEGWSVGLMSVVQTAIGTKHLLMLDFAIPISKHSEDEIFSKISIFNKSSDVSYSLDGYLIKTNKSYHYLGKYIVNESDFINFLGSSALFRHIDQSGFVIDDRWLGYTLKRNFATIRIGHKEGILPIVIREI
jgi:hypothetical protein